MVYIGLSLFFSLKSQFGAYNPFSGTPILTQLRRALLGSTLAKMPHGGNIVAQQAGVAVRCAEQPHPTREENWCHIDLNLQCFYSFTKDSVIFLESLICVLNLNSWS